MVDWFNLLFVAVMGATGTAGLQTGKLWPLSRTINRAETPKRYWLAIAACFVVVLLSLGNLAWTAFRSQP